MGAFLRRHWIPPAALLYAQLAHGLSWAIVLWTAYNAALGTPLYTFAWIHAVALGWATMAALAILLHAIPAFTDARWRAETVARWALVAYGLGVALLLYGFLAQPRMLAPGGVLVLAALVVYLCTAYATLAAAMRSEDRVDRAVARAFAITFAFLLAAAVIGFGLAWLLSGHPGTAWAAALPGAHANLGILGWLSLLIFGVSMRTLRPIAGTAPRFRWVHIAVGTLGLAGAAIVAAGEGAGSPAVAWIGGGLFTVCALLYVADVLDRLARATNPHRPPQAFVAAATLWFLTALALGAMTLLGRPWAPAYVFVLLLGWVGQMVNAHIHHIGVRVIATVYRGDDDETEPQELLMPRLSWFSFLAFQAAIALILVGLLQSNSELVARGGVVGAAGWIAMVANLLAARTRAKALVR